MDWDKIEKARKGLWTCVESDGIGCPLSCPYYEPCMSDAMRVYMPMMNDVLTEYERMMEQIKALESARIPRLLTLEEAKCTHYTMPIIVEQCQSRCENLLCAGKVKGGIRLIRANGQGFALHWSSYGPTWRMWSAFPTMEQREAVAWDE